MKKRSERMQKIFAVAESEEKFQCQQLGQAQEQLNAEAQQLRDLGAYRQSYAQDRHIKVNVSPVHWQDYQKFLQRLDQAMFAQKQKVLTNEQNRDAHRHRWMAKRRRLESLGKAIDRFRSYEESERERQMQLALDDLPPSKGLF